VLWLTNLPAPYRFPIWARMVSRVDLKVAFLLKEKNWRNWTVPEEVTWEYQYLSLASKNIKEYDIIPSFYGARQLLQEIDLVIIGGWETPFYVRTLLIAKRRRIPVIQFYESTGDSHRFKNPIVRNVRKWFLAKADFIVTIGTASTKDVEAMEISPEKIITLFNPVDVSWFDYFARSHRAPQASGHRYIYVGQLIERKNVSTLIRSFASVRTELDTLTIVGDGVLAQELLDLADILGVSKFLTFAGQRNQEELAALYAVSNTLVLASTNEVWGLVVNEALAAGLHVVVSDKCGVSDFVKSMQGTYVCTADQESIEKSLIKSRLEWTGYIDKPEILLFTPERFADEVLKVLESTKLNSDRC
jgi:glycosyltransferase involved in cell wall biosynthesis